MKATGVLYALSLFAPSITANLHPANDEAEVNNTCQTIPADLNDDYEAFDRPQIQAPLPGFSRVWRGLGLDKRQTTCTKACSSGYGCCPAANICCPVGNLCFKTGCCANDGSVPCNGGLCCPKGTLCPVDNSNKCPAAT